MEVTQIILIGFIVLLIVLYPITMYSRNKKENLRMQEQTNSLKIGDRVLTTNGIYGTIVGIRDEFERKIVTLETGDENNKGYVSVDAYAIYKIFEDETPENVEQNQEFEKHEEVEQEPTQTDELVENNDSQVGSEIEENAAEEPTPEENEDLNDVDSDDDDSDDTPKSEE